MKRFRLPALLLIVILLLSACGCGREPQEEETKKPRKTTEAPGSSQAPSGSSDAGILPTLPDPSESADPSGIIPEEEPDLDNTNYGTCVGRVTRAAGGVWFVQGGIDNDGRGNGVEYSENIYFLKDGASQAELVFSVPADYTDGIEQLTVFGVTPGPLTNAGRTVYYFRYKNGSHSRMFLESFHTGTGKITEYSFALTSSTVMAGGLTRIGNELYFRGFDADRENYYEYENGHRNVLIRLDLLSGDCAEFDPEIPLGKNEMAQMLGFGGPYLYYAKAASRGDNEPEFYGFFRKRLPDGAEEEVAAIADSRDIEGFLFTEDYLLLLSDETDRWEVIEVKSGETVSSFSEDLFDRSEYLFNVSGDTVYYFRDGAMRSLPVKGGEETVLAKGSENRELLFIAVCGEEIWFMDEDDYGVYKVRKDGRILPGSPVEPLYDREDTRKTVSAGKDGEWIVTEFKNCIFIREYTGNETELTVPDELLDKPVTMVALNLKESGVTSLTLPEGVISLRGIYCGDGFKDLYLPHSLEHMIYRGYDYTLYLPETATIHYNGTVDEWNALLSFNADLHWVSVDGQKNPCGRVECLDGTWRTPAPTTAGEAAAPNP